MQYPYCAADLQISLCGSVQPIPYRMIDPVYAAAALSKNFPVLYNFTTDACGSLSRANSICFGIAPSGVGSSNVCRHKSQITHLDGHFLLVRKIVFTDCSVSFSGSLLHSEKSVVFRHRDVLWAGEIIKLFYCRCSSSNLFLLKFWFVCAMIHQAIKFPVYFKK